MMRERKSAAVVRRGGKRARGPAALRRGSGAPSGADEESLCIKRVLLGG